MAKRGRLWSFLGVASTLALTYGGAANAQAGGGVFTTPAGDATAEALVVTGSRLAGTFRAPTPVTSLSADAIAQRAPAAAIEFINDLPAVRADSGPAQNQRGGAQALTAQTNLRGLGSARTLTLVNGMRQVGAANGAFDTNRIPVNMIERVEVVTGGASAAYGSDAVAGVLNFIYNDRLEGIRAGVQYGVAQEGDNNQYIANFAQGANFAGGRGHFIVGSDYGKVTGTGLPTSRDWGAKEFGILTPSAAQRAALGLPAFVLTNPVEYATVTPGGLITSGPLAGTAFGPGGVPYAFQFGSLVAGNQMAGSTANFGNSVIGPFFLSQPYERSASQARVTFDITPDISFFADLGYSWISSRGEGSTNQTPNAVISTLNILDTNPFIPAATRAQMVARGVTSIPIGFLNTQANPNRPSYGYVTDNESNTTQANAGFKGTLFEDWRWDASWSHGVSRTRSGLVHSNYGPNFAAATYVVTGPNGQPVCGPLATNPNLTAATRALVLPGCVPFNLFGPTSASQEAIDYVGPATRSNAIVRQDNWAANLSGSPFSTWAGAVSTAVGVEHRRDGYTLKGEGLPSAGLLFGATNGYSGSRSVTEGYAEVGVPLLRDMTFAEAIDLNAAVRRTSYEYSGDVTTYKVGGTWDINDAVRLRATQSRDIRAPSIPDLFAIGAQGTAGGNVRNPFTGVSGALLQIGGGNTALRPEVAQTVTAGMVLQPTWQWANGLRISADYYWIKVKEAIATINATETLNRCFAGIQEYCNNITFNNTAYGISLVRTTSYNLNQLMTSGVDIEVDYRVPEAALPVPGELNLRALGSYQPRLVTIDSFGVTVDRGGSFQGTLNWRWVATADYRLGPMRTTLQANYFSSLAGDSTLIGPDDPRYNPAAANTINKNLFPGMVYWNLGLQYDLKPIMGSEVQLFGNVTNLLDKDPPAGAWGANTSPSIFPYDIVGRSFKIGLRIAR